MKHLWEKQFVNDSQSRSILFAGREEGQFSVPWAPRAGTQLFLVPVLGGAEACPVSHTVRGFLLIFPDCGSTRTRCESTAKAKMTYIAVSSMSNVLEGKKFIFKLNFGCVPIVQKSPEKVDMCV